MPIRGSFFIAALSTKFSKPVKMWENAYRVPHQLHQYLHLLLFLVLEFSFKLSSSSCFSLWGHFTWNKPIPAFFCQRNTWFTRKTLSWNARKYQDILLRCILFWPFWPTILRWFITSIEKQTMYQTICQVSCFFLFDVRLMHWYTTIDTVYHTNIMLSKFSVHFPFSVVTVTNLQV